MPSTGTIGAVLFVAIGIAYTGAFHSHIPRLSELGIRSTFPQEQMQQTHNNNINSNNNHDHPQHGYGRDRVVLGGGWLEDAFRSLGLDLAAEKEKLFGAGRPSPARSKPPGPDRRAGTVVRTASKAYSETGSEPSGPAYTTRKESRGSITVRPDGVEGDYNHYRTVALAATPDRAVSILTTDVLGMLRGSGWAGVSEGDLGENISVDGVDYSFFRIGGRYRFHNSGGNDNGGGSGTVVEITERIEPCGNLCKLPYINDEKLAPKDRFEGCKKFLLYLDAREGLRGWYGRVIGTGGPVTIGDTVSPLDGVALAATTAA